MLSAGHVSFATRIPYLALQFNNPHCGVVAPEMDVEKSKRDSDVSNFDPRNIDPFMPIEKRACKYNGCTCQKVQQGQYCGWCAAVLTAGTGGNFHTDIYECNPSGGCCWYGPSSTCAGSDANDLKYCPK